MAFTVCTDDSSRRHWPSFAFSISTKAPSHGKVYHGMIEWEDKNDINIKRNSMKITFLASIMYGLTNGRLFYA